MFQVRDKIYGADKRYWGNISTIRFCNVVLHNGQIAEFETMGYKWISIHPDECSVPKMLERILITREELRKLQYEYITARDVAIESLADYNYGRKACFLNILISVYNDMVLQPNVPIKVDEFRRHLKL